MAELSAAQIESLVAGVPHWHQSVPLPHGIVAPGAYDPSTILEFLELGDLHGRRVLDVGTCDGLYAFECERRGAEVVAVDHRRPGLSGFDVAKRILDSRIEYREQNVYDLRPQQLGEFDLILFLGVIYHLRHPLLALDRLRALAKPDGLLAVESLVCDTRLFVGFEQHQRLPRGLRELPVAQFLPMYRFHADPTNKWSPNLACLRAMVEDAGFAVERSITRLDRGLVHARAASDEQRQRIRDMDGGRRDTP